MGMDGPLFSQERAIVPLTIVQWASVDVYEKRKSLHPLLFEFQAIQLIAICNTDYVTAALGMWQVQ